MHSWAKCAVAALVSGVAIVIGCSSPSTGGFGAIPDATEGPMMMTGGPDSDAGTATGCAAYLADAGDISDASDTTTPDAAFVASPCQPSGDYTNTVTNTNDCGMPTNPSGTISFDTTAPYPTFDSCTPPIAAFTDTVCAVNVPAGTVCKSGSITITFDMCGFFSCVSDGSNCTVYVNGTIVDGNGQVCHVVQTSTYKR